MSTLSIGVSLPFEVQISTCAIDHQLSIDVECARNLSQEDRLRLEAHIDIFLEAAMYGMGGGAIVPPQLAENLDLTQLLLDTDRQPSPTSVSYVVTGISVDPAYSVVLLHKLRCLAQFFIPIAKVKMQMPVANIPPGIVEIVERERSDLPEIYKNLPFDYEAELESNSQSLSLTVGFFDQPDELALNILKNACDIWVAQVLQGGYISRTNNPENFFLAPDEKCLILPNEIQWGIDKIQIDLRGLCALANFLIGFSGRILPVSYFIIE